MVRGVFFDLYGTLLIFGDIQASWKEQIATMHRFVVSKGCVIPADMLASYYQSIKSRPSVPSMDGSSLFERRLDDTCREIGLKLSDYEVSELADLCVNAWQRYSTLDPQAIPVLKTLRQSCKTALITNFDYAPHIQRILREMELSPLLDATLISDAVGSSKPQARIFELALAKTDLQAGEVVFVGDSVEDIQGALAVGMQPVYIHRPSVPALDLADLSNVKVITELAELPEWVSKING